MSLADCSVASHRNIEREACEWDLWSEAGSVRASRIVATNDHNDEVAFKMIYASIPTGDFFSAAECELRCCM